MTTDDDTSTEFFLLLLFIVLLRGENSIFTQYPCGVFIWHVFDMNLGFPLPHLPLSHNNKEKIALDFISGLQLFIVAGIQ